MLTLSPPLAAEELLPHRAPLRLLSTLTQWAPQGARGTASFAPGSPFIDSSGLVDELALIELLAQLTAAAKGYAARRAGRPAASGFLVGVNGFAFSGAPLAGETLALEVEQTLALEQACVLRGTVWSARRGAKLAEGELRVWEEAQPAGQPIIEAPAGARPGHQPFEATSASAEADLCAAPMTKALLAALEPVKIDAGTAAVRGAFPDSFLGFAGHFPGAPLLPGLLMLRLAAELGTRLAGQPLRVTRVERAKIMRQVRPGDATRMEAAWIASAGPQRRLRARLQRQGEPAATIDLELTTTDHQSRDEGQPQ